MFWRVEQEPELTVHAFRLEGVAYGEAAVARGDGGVCPVPWGELTVALHRVVTG